ncbi:hypothetical protein CDIK_1800 [Cucumispora dikerogammari]|nr:hypothetical protein CDIK_1800 [Cucumispora dikerogammari]
MLKQLFFLLNPVLNQDSNQPCILSPPTLIIETDSNIKLLDKDTSVLPGEKFIKTIIDFKEFFKMNLYSSFTSTKIFEHVKIYTTRIKGVQITDDINKKISIYKKQMIKNLNASFISTAPNETQTALVLLLRSKNKEKETLFSFLMGFEGAMAFKLKFIFPTEQRNENIVNKLDNLIKEFEVAIEPFKELHENKTCEVLNILTGDLEPTWSKNKKFKLPNNVTDVSYGKPDAEFETILTNINKSKHFSNNHKLILCIALNTLKNKNIESENLDLSETQKYIKFETISFLIKQILYIHIRNKIYELDVSNPYKHKLVNSIKETIKMTASSNHLFLSDLIRKLKENIENMSMFVTFETGLYKLNKEQNSLEEVLADD